MSPPEPQQDERSEAPGEPARPEEPRGDPAPSDAGEPQTLSLLFVAAAVGLVVLLGVIGLIAFAAMGK